MLYPSREYDARGVCGDKSKEGGWISVDREASSLSYVQSLVPFRWSTKDLSQPLFGDCEFPAPALCGVRGLVVEWNYVFHERLADVAFQH